MHSPLTLTTVLLVPNLRYGRVEMVDSLLEAGCEANAKDKVGLILSTELHIVI